MRTSPYNNKDSYQLYYDDSEYSLERMDKSGILSDSGVSHTVVEGETLQSIAFRYYRDSGRWGDIATFNEIIDPTELNSGTVLQIPL